MNIKNRLRLFQLVVMLAMVVMAASAYLSIQGAQHYLNRMQYSRQQLDSVTRLALAANRFSEQIAELLLVGNPELPEFESARDQTSEALDALRQVTLDELAFVRNSDQEAEERRELQRLDQMQALFREIDRAVERMLLFERQGRREDAIALFRTEIENRLDVEFEKLIVAAMADEQAEVLRADSEASVLSRRLILATFALLAILLAVVAAFGVVFVRSLRAPIDALSGGALAIEQGNLDHRIAYSRNDELGLLARRFNAMADELKRQRAALLAAQTDLEQQVAERTREIKEANAQLTELDRQRVRLLTDISHELRTPLTVLRGEAEVSLRGASKPESTYRAALAAIVAQAADMGRLVDDLLFLARSEADQVRFEFRRTPLATVVFEAAEEARVLAQDRKLRLVIGESRPGPTVRVDPRRLKQALLVVLDNAVKYADPQSGVEIHVGTSEHGSAQLRVRDFGPGIPLEDMPFVFDRFYRGSNAERAGSGLGLSIARWIVEKHNGSIELSSAPGDGTEVRIELPMA
jgi:signal transduction histidine kinase